MLGPDHLLHLPRVRYVHSFDELISYRWAEDGVDVAPAVAGVNALCWARALPLGFDEVIAALPARPGIHALEDAELLALAHLSAQGQAAVRFMLDDLARLRVLGLAPELDVIHGKPREPVESAVSTEVYSFHADSATDEASTYLCTYHGASSEGLANEAARRVVDIPELRLALLAECGGADDADFAEWLSDGCYDLHYRATDQAQVFRFGLGNLWRIAVEHAGCPVPPCLHRAPETRPGDTTRLLLIA